MGSLMLIAPWLTVLVLFMSHQRVECVTEPRCDVKQVNYGMYFPVPFCRDCGNHSCFVTKLSKDAESQVAEVFTGLFYTPEHIQQVEKAKLRVREIRRRKRGSSDHDGDSYCPTKLTCQNVTRLVNIYGVERQLVHLPAIGQYQWVLFGECAKVDENCPGGCVDELTTRFLLVWNLDHPDCPMSFEPFDIKTYCSCKNISVAPGLNRP